MARLRKRFKRCTTNPVAESAGDGLRMRRISWVGDDHRVRHPLLRRERYREIAQTLKTSAQGLRARSGARHRGAHGSV